MREIKINKGWKFWTGQDSFALVWNVPENAKEVDLPHDAMIEKPAHIDSPNKGNTGYRDGDIYNYVKMFFAPEEYRDKHVVLKFEGVYMNAFVYVNEQLAGKNHFGYTTFYVELDDYLRYGEENEIRVQVRNGAMTNSRWYSGGGIYRDVYLLLSDITFIQPEGVRIRTESIDGDLGVIRIDTELKNKDYKGKKIVLETRIEDSGGELAADEKVPIVLFGNNERKISSRLCVVHPLLWSEESPALYYCKSRLWCDNILLDEACTVFGIRTLSVDANRGLRINGKTVKLRGACIHHDSGLLGAATYDVAQYRQIKALKEAGFNAVRMAHNPMAPAMLRACDTLGVYVMDETFDIWTKFKSDYDYGMYFEECWETDVAAMVRKDFNHPSVIMYSIGNEIPEIGTEHGSIICHNICEKIKYMDDTRYTLAAVNGVFAVGDRIDEVVADVTADLRLQGKIEGNVNHFMALMDTHMDDIVVHPIITQRLDMVNAYTDIAGYNYMTGRYEMDGYLYPNRVIVGSETYPPEIARNWRLVEKLPYVIGDFTWTGYGYIGEAGDYIPQTNENVHMGMVQQLSAGGDLDICGFRRPVSYWREIVFGKRREPYIAVQNPAGFNKPAAHNPWILSNAVSSWSWKGQEGKNVLIEVYSPEAEVELFVNRVSLGRKTVGEETGYRVFFETIYEPGILTAVSYDECGKIVGRYDLKTAKKERHLHLKEENISNLNKYPAYNMVQEIENLQYVQIEICDDEGNIAADENWKISIHVEGSAEIIGLGSGDICPGYDFKGTITETYDGRALLILKKKNKYEESRIIATSKEYGESKAILV